MLGTITIGTLLSGRYEIIRFLGQGGFAETYLAKDKQMPMEMECVVKCLKPQATDSETLQAARVLFDMEAQVLYELGGHDQIPRLLAHFEENQEFYLVEDFVDGEDLQEHFTANQPWTEAQVLDLLEQVLKILAFVHQHKVIHRDIKPSNLMRCQDNGKIVLIDFGAVKQVHTQVVTAGGHTSFLVSVGTSGYMPNEQQGGKPRYSSDIYALGMTAIHALTGKSPDQLPEDRTTGEFVWRPYAQPVSYKLAAILDKMVRVHFRDRYQTVEAVLDDLQSVSAKTITPNLLITEKGWQQFALKSKMIVRQWQTFLKPGSVWIVVGAVVVTLGAYKMISPSTYEPDVCIEEGWELISSYKYEKALAKCERVSIEQLNNVEAAEVLVVQGASLYFLERYEEALTLLEKAGELNPDNVIAWEGQARSLYGLRRYEEAVNAFEKALNIDPDSPYLLSLLAEAWAALGRFDQAFKSLDRATNVDPDNPTTWKSKGFILYRQKHYSEALYNFNEAIENFKRNYENLKNDPNYIQTYADAWFGKGLTLEEFKRYDQVMTCYDKALELKPNFQEAKEARQELIEKMGR